MPTSNDELHLVETDEIEALRSDILRHLEGLGLPSLNGSSPNQELSKEQIRASHAFQRAANLQREVRAVSSRWPLLKHFANGSDVKPEAIDPELVLVHSNQETGELFRLATLLWSVPVSRGFGRRMRYLVRDRRNGKLIGLFALGDPVFNLQARDKWIGWNVNDRRARLVNVMDAYVVGAVPPYAQLLGGKLVAALIGSAEVSATFSARYSDYTGIISGEKKAAHLALVTVTSALGRSSLYNRLKRTTQNGEQRTTLVELLRIGSTRGYGHFQLSDDLFERLRQLLVREEHAYANGHRFGQGPNWRMRVARVGLARLGLDAEQVRHGIPRGGCAMPLATNSREFLCGRTTTLDAELPTAKAIATAALERWTGGTFPLCYLSNIILVICGVNKERSTLMAMMDRFTKRAKLVLVDAGEEARRFNHTYIGTEHLLLALIRDDAIAGFVLRELGVELPRARSAVEFVVGHGEQRASEVPQLTASAKKVIEYALEEARKLNHHYVGTEHLLLGLLVKGEGIASGVLEMLGVERKQLAQTVFSKMGIDQAEQRAVATTFLDTQQGSRSVTYPQNRPQQNRITWLLAAALGAALVYITRLQRALVAARQRGDTYRDLAGDLDRKQDDQS